MMITEDRTMVDVNGTAQYVSELSAVESHIYWESVKYHLDFSDLLNATRTIENKYRGNWDEEQLFASKVVNHSEHLWGIAYHTALYAKAAKMEIWPHHNPLNPYDPKNIDR